MLGGDRRDFVVVKDEAGQNVLWVTRTLSPQVHVDISTLM